MLRYLIRRILYAVPILLGVALLTFIIFYATATPEQMARRSLSAKNPSQEQITTWIKLHGYDKPKSEQFKKHMTELFLFKFGKSDYNQQDIWEKIRLGAPASTLLATLEFIGSFFVTIIVAVVAAYYRGTYLDTLITTITIITMSITYLVYIIALQFLLGKVLKYFPLGGYRGGADALRFVVLPTIVAIISGLGGGVRLYRTFLLEEIGQDYVRTARAKGVGEREILFKHVLKNASIPIITSVVLTIPFLILGSLLLESFFGIPGIGSMTQDAIVNQDFAVIRAMVFLGTVLYIIGAMLTDICYALVDPRVRFE